MEIFSVPIKQLSNVSPAFAATWLTSTQSTTSPLLAAGLVLDEQPVNESTSKRIKIFFVENPHRSLKVIGL